MASLRRVLLGLCLMVVALPALGDPRLLMLREDWCEWCERWEAEVGVVYDRTAEGRRAPLIRADIHAPLPEGIALARRAHFTPTFVLIENGREIGRIEGYPGEGFFYGLLGRLLDRLDDTQPDGRTDNDNAS